MYFFCYWLKIQIQNAFANIKLIPKLNLNISQKTTFNNQLLVFNQFEIIYARLVNTGFTLSVSLPWNQQTLQFKAYIIVKQIRLILKSTRRNS